MLQNLLDNTISSNFLLLEDTLESCSEDLFAAFLAHFTRNEGVEDVHVLCLEHPPNHYVDSSKVKFEIHDFFNDPLGWNGHPGPGLNEFLSNFQICSGKVLFIDSVYHLVLYLGFFNAYKILKGLKALTKTIIGLVHKDLFNLNQLEKLELLSTTCVKVQDCADGVKMNKNNIKVVDVITRKASGKVNAQIQTISIDSDLKLVRVNDKDRRKLVSGSSQTVKNDLTGLTTFELGLQMKENEKKAKEELVLPYLRNEGKGGAGEVIYDLEAIDLEDDPDDDLDI